MEKIFVALLLLSAVAANASEQDEDECTQAGFFPSSSNCLNFYRCVDWYGSGKFFSKFDFVCPVGTVWDDVVLTCNHPWAVSSRPECMGGSESTGTIGEPESKTDPSTGDTTTTTESPDGTTSAEKSAEKSAEETDSSEVGEGSPPTLVCDQKLRRHPTYCNKYYTCHIQEDDVDVDTQTCPPELVYYEDTESCAKPKDDDEDCKMAPPPTPLPGFTTEQPDTGSDETTTDSAIETTTVKEWKIDSSSLYECPDIGYYPFERDCARFYKCIKVDEETLKGLLYICPDEYQFSEEEGWCAKISETPACTITRMSENILSLLPATKLHVDDLLWFFSKNDPFLG